MFRLGRWVMRLGWTLVFAVLGLSFGRAQTQIEDSVPILLVDSGTDCSSMAVRVEVHVDLTGVTGNGHLAGLNGFVIEIELSRSRVLAFIEVGHTPPMAWRFAASDRDTVNVTNRLKLLGVCPDPQAPNGDYHLATLVLSGIAGEVMLEVQAPASSLASRRVAGDGPGRIPIAESAPLTVEIPENFHVDAFALWACWRLTCPTLDLVAPVDRIDVRDCIRWRSCATP